MGAAASCTAQLQLEATKPSEGDDIVNSGPASFEAARSEVRRLRQALWEHTSRLPSLGPFHLVRLREKHVRIVAREVPNAATPVVFEIAGPRSLVDLCQHNNYPMVGRVSRLRPLTFDAKQLEKAGIHPHAAWFGFCYPTQRGIDGDDGGIAGGNTSVKATSNWNELEDCRKSFLAAGGFVYFDQEFNILHVTALVPSDAATAEGQLEFDGPFPLPASVGAAMARDQSFQKVTLPALLAVGAREFAWLGPGDERGNTLQPLAHDGAFVYRFDQSCCDCFFRVSQAAQSNDLDRLGPFALARVRTRNLRVQLLDTFEAASKRAGVEYEVVGPISVLTICEKLNMGRTARLSKSSPITLSPDRLDKAGIHPKAVAFAFCYPLTRAIEVTPSELKLAEVDPRETAVAFLLYGGFIYFDKRGRALHLNALQSIEEPPPQPTPKRNRPQLTVDTGESADAGALLFDGPFRLSESFVQRLDDLDQMSALTVSEFRMMGATAFCWVGPNDIPIGLELPYPIPHGAFMYRFGEISDPSNMAPTPRRVERQRRSTLSVGQRDKEDFEAKRARMAAFEARLKSISIQDEPAAEDEEQSSSAADDGTPAVESTTGTTKTLTVRTMESEPKLRHRYFPVKDPSARKMLSLGPFELTYLAPKWLDIAVNFPDGEKTEGEYQIIGPEVLVSFIRGAGAGADGLIGTLSALTSITLDGQERERANIHPNARHFAFAYPIAPAAALDDMTDDPESGLQLDELDMTDPRVAFIFTGGFVYLDEEYNPLHVTVLAQGPGLFFEGPFHLPLLFAKRLERENRLKPVTLFQLHEQGAAAFTWIAPDSVTQQSIPGVPIPHGAFAYTCRNIEVRSVRRRRARKSRL